MNRAEYEGIEKLIVDLDDVNAKAIFRFIISLLRELNPGDES